VAGPDQDPGGTSFREILVYTACLLAGIAALALLVGWVLTKL
jgi:hypothetical protein